MRRIGKWVAWIAAVVLGVPLLLGVIVLVGANTAPGQHLIERLVPGLTGHTVELAGLAGRFPDRLRARRVALTDPAGAYLVLNDVLLDWSPTRLVHDVLDVDRLDARSAAFDRMPASSSSGGRSDLPVRVVLHEFHVDQLTIAAAVAGQNYALGVQGAGELASYTTGHGQLTVRQSGRQGVYSLNGAIDAQHIRASIKANEPAHGLIAGVAGLPDLGAVAIDATLDGPRDAVATHLAISAGPLRAHADGTLDLTHQAADLAVAATAPAMTPRPGVAWQSVVLDAHVKGPFSKPDATGQVRIDALRAVGATVAKLTADVNGNAGQVHLAAIVDGLTLPGQDPTLFASAPVLIDATAQLDAPDRPVVFTLRHPLVNADGTVKTAGPLQAQVALDLPDLAPVAAAGGTELRGHTALALNVAQQNGTTNVSLDGTIGVTGGQAQAQALLGDAAHIDLAASLTGSDARLTRLHVTGRNTDVSANGSLINDTAELHWTAHLPDLSALQPTLAGHIEAQGDVSGPVDNLTTTADLSGEISTQGVQSGPVTLKLRAEGLPKSPRGTLTAQGALLGAPVDVALAVERQDGGVHVAIQRGDWKSLHASGDLTLPQGATVPTGQLNIAMAHLGDLQPLLGRPLAGSIDATVDASEAEAKLTLIVQGAALPATASVGHVALNATVTGLTNHPVVDGTLALDGIAAGSLGGSARVTARGPADALGVTLTANLPQLSGAAARIDASATVDATSRRVTVASMTADWKRQTLRLLTPVRLDLGGGAVAIDHLRLGLRQAVLEVNGRVGPTLDLTASLHGLPVDLATLAEPFLTATGTISADARLTGTTARPEGTVRLTASAIRVSNGPGAALPPANLTATATLSGTTARLDTRVTAGSSHLTLTGSAPLTASSAMDLHATGAINLSVLDPILTAQGRRVRGQVSLDATITGTTAAPRASGSARLTNGEAQDYAQGVHITDIAAVLQADGDRLRLAQFIGRAGEGTISGSGTIDLTPPMPVNLTFTADNARPIASDTLTALIDAHMAVRGDVAGTLTVAGTLHMRKAEVQVPEKLPSSVVTLPVRNANAPPPKAAPPPAPATNVALNITLDAPQQVFVRGRGLDVELGGQVHIGGTLAHPQPNGGLKLRQGTLSVAGQTLTFTEGSIDFNGAGLTDPAIRLVATQTTSTVVATLTVSGSAKDPKITLSSVPDMPQDEILAALLFQQSTSKLSPFQMAEIASALASLSGATSGIGDPLARLRNSLGLDRLSVGTGSTGAPTLEAGRYVAPGVYLGAQQSATGNGTQATVQIDIAKGLKLETTAGSGSTSATGATSGGDAASVGLSYQFEY